MMPSIPVPALLWLSVKRGSFCTQRSDLSCHVAKWPASGQRFVTLPGSRVTSHEGLDCFILLRAAWAARSPFCRYLYVVGLVYLDQKPHCLALSRLHTRPVWDFDLQVFPGTASGLLCTCKRWPFAKEALNSASSMQTELTMSHELISLSTAWGSRFADLDAHGEPWFATLMLQPRRPLRDFWVACVVSTLHRLPLVCKACKAGHFQDGLVTYSLRSTSTIWHPGKCDLRWGLCTLVATHLKLLLCVSLLYFACCDILCL